MKGIKAYLPILQWLPNYKKEHLNGDLFAGLTVGIMLIPQGMAYALIAGLPPVYGLYASIVPQLIYAILGTSRQLSVGPVAMDSLLVATIVSTLTVDPDRYIKTFAELGASILTVHYEACTHLHRTIQAIKDTGMKAGVALNPHTPVAVLEDVIKDVDLVCIMSVNPGFGGQSFIENTYKKVSQLKHLIEFSESNCQIEIDGGVTDKNVNKLIEAGADVLVAGSYVFKSDHPIDTISNLKNQIA